MTSRHQSNEPGPGQPKRRRNSWGRAAGIGHTGGPTTARDRAAVGQMRNRRRSNDGDPRTGH